MDLSDLDKKTVTVNGVVFTHQDIYNVVEAFYTRVQHDPILSVPFRSVHDWPDHIKRLTHFWWIKFGGKPYMFSQYNPVLKHYYAGFNAELLERWLTLFHETLREKLSDDQYQLWALISRRMGQGLNMKNEMLKAHLQAQQAQAAEDAGDNDSGPEES